MCGLVCLLRRGTSLLGRHIRVDFGTRNNNSNSNHKQVRSRSQEPRPRHSPKQEHRECTWKALACLLIKADGISVTPDPTLVRLALSCVSTKEVCLHLGARAGLVGYSAIWIQYGQGRICRLRNRSFLYEFGKIPMRRGNELNFPNFEPALWSTVYPHPPSRACEADLLTVRIFSQLNSR